MKRKILFIVTSDPRKSGKAAEAIRMAAGVGTWKKVDVLVYLHGPAVLALSEYVDELVDEDNFSRYFPIIGEWGDSIFAQADEPLLEEIGESPLKFKRIDMREVSRISAGCQSVLTF